MYLNLLNKNVFNTFKLDGVNATKRVQDDDNELDFYAQANKGGS